MKPAAYQRLHLPSRWADKWMGPSIDLRSYMSSEYFEDVRIIQDVETSLYEICRTFGAGEDTSEHAWPYEIRSNVAAQPKARSQSTSAMILCAILGIRNTWQLGEWPRGSSGLLFTRDFPLPSEI